MKLKVPTCDNCESHKWSEISYRDNEYSMNCSICEQKTNGTFKIHKVPFPTVVFPDGSIIKELDTEMEIFYDESTEYPFGVRVDIYTHDISNQSDITLRNITEFHYLFDNIRGEEKVALESDIHYHGGTRSLNTIKFLKISRETEKQDSYYS